MVTSRQSRKGPPKDKHVKLRGWARCHAHDHPGIQATGQRHPDGIVASEVARDNA